VQDHDAHVRLAALLVAKEVVEVEHLAAVGVGRPFDNDGPVHESTITDELAQRHLDRRVVRVTPVIGYVQLHRDAEGVDRLAALTDTPHRGEDRTIV